MELKQLKHFIAIVDYGSFSKAALEIPISQPALTRSLQNLEASLDTELLERSTRGLLLTPSGEQLYERAKLILNEVQKTKTELNSKHKKAQFNIGIAPLFSSAIIPQAILEFSAEHPDDVLNITRGLFPALIEQLSQGVLDAVFANLPFADMPDDLIIEPLFDVSVRYICSANHPLAKKTSIPFKALLDYPWAVVDEDNSNEVYRTIFASEGVVKDPISVKTNSLSLLKSLVMQPPYITLLPYHMVAQEMASSGLAQLNVKGTGINRKGGLIYRRNSLESPARTALFKAIRQACEATKP